MNPLPQKNNPSKAARNAIDGILLLNKPIGISSNAALQRVKRLLNAQKIGHTGSLDPLAHGLLPLCLGEATKISQYLLAADKSYRVTARLGIRTLSGDADGEIISKRPVPPLNATLIDQALMSFRGELQQVPPMYSALKHQGQPLYQLARRGIEVERAARAVTITRLEVLGFEQQGDEHYLSLELDCTKGTYVRTLVDDLGELLGCGAYITSLYRFKVGDYNEDAMVSIDTLDTTLAQEGLTATLARYLLPSTSALRHINHLALDSNSALYLRQGNTISAPHTLASGLVCLTDSQGEFLGVGEILADGRVAPRRLVSQA